MNSAPQSHQIYLRFHIQLDKAVRQAAVNSHKKPARFVADVLEEFATQSLQSPFPAFSPLCELYRLKIGRSVDRAPRMTGKPMLVTVSEIAYQQLLIVSMRLGVSSSMLRSDILSNEMIRTEYLK